MINPKWRIKFKKFEKIKSVPKDVPKSHNDDTNPHVDPKTHIGTSTVELFFVMILTFPYAYKLIFYV